MKNYILAPIPDEKFSELSRNELIALIKGEQQIRQQMETYLEALGEQIFKIAENYIRVKTRLFSPSSERSPRPNFRPYDRGRQRNSPKKKTSRLPSERYPDAPIIEEEIEFENPPECRLCDGKLSESGMAEVSEYLNVIPRQYMVVRQFRKKYRCCQCHGDIQTAPAPPRITPRSSYSDDLVVDVAMSKYCDLIPIERYCAMAGRENFAGLPPQSLIGLTHQLADFLQPVLELIRQQILSSRVLHADETPHRMLEGDKTNNWYLWGFSNDKACYFECHDTRSGDVASAILKQSECEYLISDVFSGYQKAVKQTNIKRENNNEPQISNAYCNAHSRRKFKEADQVFAEESKFYLEKYQSIYAIEAKCREKPENEIFEIRQQMQSHFENLKNQAQKDIEQFSNHSSLVKACKYFLNNYDGLTLFMKDAEIGIDNNPQERSLRNPVIGRKTWYGTHSKRGALTASVLFSIVESCKLNKVNPRKYIKSVVKQLHQEKPPFAPSQMEEFEKT